jgi:hypothetical protein
MDKQNKPEHKDRLTEQQAPLKNTDHAFVQVGRDGGPVVPQRANIEDEREKDDLRDPDRVTTIKHR